MPNIRRAGGYTARRELFPWRSRMTMVVATETPPLVADVAGVFHVGKTRVTLDTVVGAFQDGATAEPDGEGRHLLPSVVRFGAEGPMVGEAAKSRVERVRGTLRGRVGPL
ncbi:MAG: hypothetical protein LGR52_14905 [Candidatus Thiosymbion ectosymbiont of Robbea hypermnestra]|nr:hypothetical protein [Candidatus Thiosymbion ectosymbiont of Robbea hypermnestra]